MTVSGSASGILRDRLWRLGRAVVLAGLALFVIRVALAGMNQAFHTDNFSESLAIKVDELPRLFPVHMITGGLALLVVPLAYGLRRWPRWHRPVGASAALLVVISGLTAYPVAWVNPVNAWSAAGFMVQATVWLALLALGLIAIARGQRREHRAAMTLMMATTFGAVFFRFWLALWAIMAHGRHFVLFYVCDAWFAWLLPLAVTAWWLKRTGACRVYSR